MTERIGDWIEVYNGEKFYPLDPRPEEVSLENIAHGLSLMCRFNGQCSSFFSVAQHSINVMKEVEYLTQNLNPKTSLKAQALAILHDASECLGISDICAPAKRYMPEYRAIEQKVQDAVWVAFGLQHTEEEYEIVDYVDKAISAFEAKELMKCKYWDISTSYLSKYTNEQKPYIDLSFRNMKEVEDEFFECVTNVLSKLKQLEDLN